MFCVATRIDHGSVGIIDHAMPSMAIRGFIAHNRKSGAYTLTDSGRAPAGGDPWRPACLSRALLAQALARRMTQG